MTLQPDDLVIAGGDALFRIDRDQKESIIASGGYLTAVRGLAFGVGGVVLVTTQACRQGAVVAVDPNTGTQTPIALGFRTAMGIALESDGKSVLVGDENPGNDQWGKLVRINLETRGHEEVAILRVQNAARSIALFPNSRDVYVADKSIQRIDANGEQTLVEVDKFENVMGLAISRSGEIFAGDYKTGTVFQMKRGVREPVAIDPHDSLGRIWTLALSNDEKQLFVGVDKDFGTVYSIDIPFNKMPPVQVWKGRRSGGGSTVVAVVPRKR